MRRFVAFGAIAGCALGGCSFEHNTMLTNTAYDGRYTDGDFAEKDAAYASRELAASLRNAGFSVTRRSTERLLADQDFVVTPGRWVVESREEVENPDTGKTEININRRFEREGESVSLTITCDVVVERTPGGRVRAVRYQIWPESPRVHLPIAGGPAETSASPHDVFMGAVRDVVNELGTPLVDDEGEIDSEGAGVDG